VPPATHSPAVSTALRASCNVSLLARIARTHTTDSSLRPLSLSADARARGVAAALHTSSAVGPLPALGGKLLALRGPVANGYGRGSRKLGIPTANLPCSLFQAELEQLPCGVYVGWARVRGATHKCVCNIGFSPTFAGEENPEKIVRATQRARRRGWGGRVCLLACARVLARVCMRPLTSLSHGGGASGAAVCRCVWPQVEAHIMADFESDFYGEEMCLLLLGFIRDERKFGGLDELLSTIRSDIATATAALDLTPLAEAADATWLTTPADDERSEMVLIEPTSLLQATDDVPPPPKMRAATAAASAVSIEPMPPAGFEWGVDL
jgi:hypothetical protein